VLTPEFFCQIKKILGKRQRPLTFLANLKVNIKQQMLKIKMLPGKIYKCCRQRALSSKKSKSRINCTEVNEKEM
jgi:hypothetical protein